MGRKATIRLLPLGLAELRLQRMAAVEGSRATAALPAAVGALVCLALAELALQQVARRAQTTAQRAARQARMRRIAHQYKGAVLAASVHQRAQQALRAAPHLAQVAVGLEASKVTLRLMVAAQPVAPRVA